MCPINSVIGHIGVLRIAIDSIFIFHPTLDATSSIFCARFEAEIRRSVDHDRVARRTASRSVLLGIVPVLILAPQEL